MRKLINKIGLLVILLACTLIVQAGAYQPFSFANTYETLTITTTVGNSLNTTTGLLQSYGDNQFVTPSIYSSYTPFADISRSNFALMNGGIQTLDGPGTPVIPPSDGDDDDDDDDDDNDPEWLPVGDALLPLLLMITIYALFSQKRRHEIIEQNTDRV